ncbi:hypothetical protein A4H97_16330 [Niastella yeongjuensis]|uniref:Uncharacterized protein n=1 Tax=Niastella yeongjuensis TaxID=354355 RepID=A0A1V9E138_9BACT|nr:hypothetical protein [Niastella yeongjuensis]OQP39789.1 hypothetical protein A4H97_16330 [Niastella yeongjuensis]SEO05495.1 hypothetical protein SAMN05660816_02012 [Niastella yeongjuensis]
MNTEIFKQISIRGRFAFGLTCVEKIIDHYRIKDALLDSVIEGFWRFTSAEKWGEYEGYLYNRDPDCVLSDFPSLKIQPEKKHEFGYDDISYSELESIYELYLKLPPHITGILTHLTTIANSNISAGCGEYSECTFAPTLEILAIIEDFDTIDFYKPADFLFSGFDQQSGWGDEFSKADIERKK